jgi:hypothetical protein
MNDSRPWGWAVLFLLGAYHGINPAMGWLFAVALGLQKKSSLAVWQSLLPIAAGHVLAIGFVVTAAVLANAALPLPYVKVAVACILFSFGLYRLLRNGHFRWGGMQIGFRDLSVWSFLMASAHGAGFMLLPVLLKMSAAGSVVSPLDSASHAHMVGFQESRTALAAVIVHALGYLLVTGSIAYVVYEKFGLALLRKAWLNLDLLWALTLMVTAGFTLLIRT